MAEARPDQVSSQRRLAEKSISPRTCDVLKIDGDHCTDPFEEVTRGPNSRKHSCSEVLVLSNSMQ